MAIAKVTAGLAIVANGTTATRVVELVATHAMGVAHSAAQSLAEIAAAIRAAEDY
jgi:hypothetical protein